MNKVKIVAFTNDYMIFDMTMMGTGVVSLGVRMNDNNRWFSTAITGGKGGISRVFFNLSVVEHWRNEVGKEFHRVLRETQIGQHLVNWYYQFSGA